MHAGGSVGGRRSRRWTLGADGDAATSPLAILLLVALSLVLVGSVAVFVFDLGGAVGDPAPQASIDAQFDDDAGAVAFAHGGGDGIGATGSATLTVVATDASTGAVQEYAWTGGSDGVVRSDGRFVVDDRTGTDTGNATVPWTFADGDTVVVRFERDGRSFELASYTVSRGSPRLSFSLDPRTDRSLWYRLDETDGSGSGDVAYARGATDASGKYGGAYAFDGDDHAALRQSYASSDAFQSMTACAWFRTSEDSTGEFDNWALLDFDRSEYFNLYALGNGSVGFSTSARTGTGSAVHDLATASTFADGAWHHACAVYEDDGTKRIYVDGSMEATASGVHGGDPLGSGATRYGFIGDGSEADSFDGSRNSNHYTGRVDEVRLYTTALDASDVAAASDPATAPTADLELYYALDDVVTDDTTGFPVVDAAPRDGQPTGTSYAFGGEPGVDGTAFEFANDQYVALNASYAQSGVLPEFTACAWFQTTESGGGQTTNWALLDFDRSEYFNLYVHGDGRVGFSTSARAGTGSVDDLYTSGTYNDGDWHLACGVYDDGEKRIVVDGQEAASRSNVHGGDAVGSGATRYAFIGDGSEATAFDGARNDRYYTGLIDDVRLYDRALATSTAAGLYVDGVGASGDRVVTTEPREFDAAVDPATLAVEDVVASTPGASGVEIRVQSDPDGDGTFEETSDPISASGAPASVSGLASDSARYRLEVTLVADGGDVPDFESATLATTGSPSMDAPGAAPAVGAVAPVDSTDGNVTAATAVAAGSTAAARERPASASAEWRVATRPAARTASLFGASAVRIG
jgi:FlaG/FlaF family flagellin (archaellin)